MTSSCKADKHKCMPPQKVVIPKGMINPDETTVIEIPARLHKQPIVVAKRKCCEMPEPCGVASECRNMAHSRRPNSFDPAFHSTGISQQSHCSYPPPNCSNVLEDSMGKTEAQERIELQRDLEDFQKARRKLLANASKLASQEPGSDTGTPTFDPNCCRKKQKSKLHPEYDKNEYSRQLYDTLD